MLNSPGSLGENEKCDDIAVPTDYPARSVGNRKKGEAFGSAVAQILLNSAE